MRNRSCYVLLLTVGLVWGSAAELFGQMGTGRVAGSVKDQQGNPIAGAEVVAKMGSSELTATTDEKGNWAILGFRTGQYEFTFKAPGFRPFTTTMRVQQMGRNPRMDIVLEKVPTGQSSGGGAAAALLEEANQLFREKQYDAALAKYQELLAKDPTLYQVHLNIGMTYREMGRIDEALAEFRAVLEQEPSNAAANVNIGEIYVQQGQLDEAVEYFEKALEGAPQDEVLHFNIAEIYFNTGNAEKAIEYYAKARDLKPDWVEPYLKLGYAYLNLGKLDEAAQAFEKVVEVAPDSPQAQMAQAALESLKNR